MKNNIKPIKTFDFNDFEIDNNALITFLKNYGDFEKLEVKSLDYKPIIDDKYIIIEKEYINLANIPSKFPNISFIVDSTVLFGNCYLIIS